MWDRLSGGTKMCIIVVSTGLLFVIIVVALIVGQGILDGTLR